MSMSSLALLYLIQKPAFIGMHITLFRYTCLASSVVAPSKWVRPNTRKRAAYPSLTGLVAASPPLGMPRTDLSVNRVRAS